MSNNNSDAAAFPPSFDEMVKLIEKNFKDCLQYHKCFTPKEIEQGWQRYKILNHLFKDEQAVSDTQLPSEWQNKIKKEGLNYSLMAIETRGYIAGATAYATQLHQTQQDKEKVTGYLRRVMNIMSWLELPNSDNADLLNEIKTFLDGAK